MSTSTTMPSDGPTTAPFAIRRFTVDEYHRMISARLLGEEDQLELLEGWITPKMTPRSPRHDNAIEFIDDALRPLLPAGWRLRIQSAMTTEDSEPEPDLMIVRGSGRERPDSHPRPGDIAMVVEVSESSLNRDREKRRLYARAGVPVYWIFNLQNDRLEVYSSPNDSSGNAGYNNQEFCGAADHAPLILDGKQVATLAVADLLP